jgi:hypothetical protein
MVREPDATMQPAPQDIQLALRLEWRGQDGQNETEQPDHSATLGNFIAARGRHSRRLP